MHELPENEPVPLRHTTSTTGLAELDAPPYTDSQDSSIHDGRVWIDTKSKIARTPSVLYPSEKEQEPPPAYQEHPDHVSTTAQEEPSPPCKLNIVIQIVGSRGDVQPFLALGNEFQRSGHRVRIATHHTFAQFVIDSGLEFYPIGGDPHELMAYMVKNPGLIPSMKSLRAGEIEKKRLMVLTMLEGCWESCICPDPLTNKPFVADAIIANPPSFAHVHCAQALGIPVHVMFTMPWTSTLAFPHPLANLRGGDVGEGRANYLSYHVVEWMTWQGLGDIINRFRRSIDLEEVAMFDGPVLAKMLKIPHSYCWSPALIPKPQDWADHIDICGFFFRDEPKYSPPPDLQEFLVAGSKPIYIGFGSIVLENAAQMFATIIEAVRRANVRAIISTGWSSLPQSSGGGIEGSDDVYFIGDCPHEWLFQQVAAVVHHGGAGTTACGLKYGVPTVIVPFFGDQPFWGSMVAKAGAGPHPIHHKILNVDNLSTAIRFCLTQDAKDAAGKLSDMIRAESGIKAAAASFHRHLPPANQSRCDLLPTQPAVWRYEHGKMYLRLSKLAGQILIAEGLASQKRLKPYQSRSYHIETTRWDPISGGSSAVLGTATDMATSITGMVHRPFEEQRIKRYRATQRRQQQQQQQQQQHQQQRQSPEEEGSQTDISTSGQGNARSPPPSLKGGKGKDNKQKEKKEQDSSAATIAALTSAKSLANIIPTATKGMLVTIPLALTDGLKNIPRHYNSPIRDHGPVTDAKTGVIVAGKTLAFAFADGLSDLVIQPYVGAREEGAVGAVKGAGKGAGNLLAKTGAGMFGLFAYNSQGIARSLRWAWREGTRRSVARARLEEGEVLARGVDGDEREAVVAAYKRLGLKEA